MEKAFQEYFASQNLATLPTAFDGRSDYEAFQNNGVPAGGLFSGAEEIKTAAQVGLFGGTAGVAYDPNYHQAGDGRDEPEPDRLRPAVRRSRVGGAALRPGRAASGEVRGTDAPQRRGRTPLRAAGGVPRRPAPALARDGRVDVAACPRRYGAHGQAQAARPLGPAGAQEDVGRAGLAEHDPRPSGGSPAC